MMSNRVVRLAAAVGLLVVVLLVVWFGGGMLWAAIPGNAPHSLSTALP
jgi:hypothetical protein